MILSNCKTRLLVALASCPTVAYGQSDEQQDNFAVDLSANIAVVSDYRFRGISLSDRDPALQGGVDASIPLGFFAGAWASTVADTGGSNVELDLYGGYANELAGVGYSFMAVGYVYPGGEDVNYYEFFGTLERSVGDAAVQVEVAYIPEQANFSDDNVYVSAATDIPVPSTPFYLNLGIGRESSVGFRKWDWIAGLSWSYEFLTLSASYVDTNYGDDTEAGRLGRAGAVISLSADF